MADESAPNGLDFEDHSLTGFLVFLFFLSLTLTLCSALLVMNLSVRGQTEVVPSLAGKTLSQAISSLGRQALILKKDGTTFHESIPADYVVSQVPAAGEKVKRGRVVKVMVSLGPALAVNPDLKGTKAPDAEATLQSNRLKLGEIISVSSAEYPAGQIISQEPEPLVSLSRDTIVNLLVSTGPEPLAYAMPDLVSKKWQDMQPLLSSHKLFLGRVAVEPATNTEPGVILSQQPSNGDKVLEGTFISLKVASLPKKTQANFVSLEYPVPAGGKEKKVKIVVIDDRGSRDIFDDMAGSGVNIELSVGLYGKTLAQFFINNALAEEKWVQ